MGGETSPIPASVMAAAAAMGEGEATRQKRKKKPKPKHGELGAAPSQSTHASKPLPAGPSFQTPGPGTPILEEAAAEAATRKRKIRKDQKAAAPPLAQNPTLEEEGQGEEAVLATTKKKKHKSSPSPSTAAAAETPILEQEERVTKKRERIKDQEPSAYSPLALDRRQAQSQGTKAPHASKLLPAVPFLEASARSPASGTSILEEAAMRKRKMCKEQKIAHDTTLEEQREDGMSAKMKKKKESKHMVHTLSSHSTSIAAEVNKKQKQSKDQEQSCYTPLPLDPVQTQAQGTNAPHASNRLPAAPSLEAPAPSPAPGTPVLEELAVTAVMRKRKICKEKKAAALSFAQNTALEEQREDGMLAKMKKKDSKRMEAEKQKQRKQQEPSGRSPLPPELGQTHWVRSQGGKAPPEQEQEAEERKGSSIDKKNGTRPCVRVLSKRELIKEGSKKPRALPEGFVPFSNFVSSCTEQNPDHSSPYIAFFDQFRYNPVRKDHKPPLPRTPDRLARLPSRGNSSFESSQLTANETSSVFKSNTSVASKTKQQDSVSSSQQKLNVEVKENLQKKMREMNQRKPSGDSLPDPSQTCCIQLQGTKAPPEQDQNADALEVDNIKKSNCKKARVRGPSKRKLFKEMSKEQMLPEGFLAPSDCTHLSMFPPRGCPSIELPELSANGTSKASKGSSSVARKSKKKDSGSGSASGSQEKLNAEEKKNPEKQREPPPLLTRTEKCSDKYRRVPLDRLVPPPRSPHNLLQENYASDPWKVIVICMLLNLTQGKQVKKIVEGFFECYPDPHAAINADPEKMEGYLTSLGLQRIKTTRIQTFSKQYVENDWTYITELCGVGKYAADAYAIFCAGRAAEVVPKDHKLVDYWNYVCSELPMVQGSQSVQEAGVADQKLAVIC